MALQEEEGGAKDPSAPDSAPPQPQAFDTPQISTQGAQEQATAPEVTTQEAQEPNGKITTEPQELSATEAQVPKKESTTQENEEPNKKIITSWAVIRAKTSTGRIGKIFKQTNRTHVIANTCSDNGFLEFIKKRYMEMYGKEMDSDKIMLFFVKACYMEYYLKEPVDHLAVERSRNMKIEKLKDEYVQKKKASPTPKIPPSPELSAEDAEEPNKEIVTKWFTVRTNASTAQVHSLFRKIQGGYAFLKTCSDKDFAEFIKKRYKDVYGHEMQSEKMMVFFVKACYMEYFLKYTVDYVAVEQSRSGQIEKLNDYNKKKKDKKKKKPQESPASKRPAEEPCPSEVVAPKRPRATASSSLDVKPPESECPICSQGFTTEGWYTLGSCGHEYHIMCLLLHAMASCSCVVCKVDIPKEFYATLESNKPSLQKLFRE